MWTSRVETFRWRWAKLRHFPVKRWHFACLTRGEPKGVVGGPRPTEGRHLNPQNDALVTAEKGVASTTPHTCPYRKSNPDLFVMQPAENRPRYNPAKGVHSTWNGRVLAQRQVRTDCVVIVQV